MKSLTITATAIAAFFIYASSATATTYTFNDDWINWPGTGSSLHSYADQDENGTPKVDHMDVTVVGGFLTNVTIVLHDNAHRQSFDSLFINTSWDNSIADSWDDWNYFVHDEAGDLHSSAIANTTEIIPDKGLYTVDASYNYTVVKNANRIGNPNGIDAGSLTLLSGYNMSNVSQTGLIINYNFSGMNLSVQDGFFVAYAPWCANDVLGGGAPVPEPATMLLFGAGLSGLAAVRLRRKKKQV